MRVMVEATAPPRRRNQRETRMGEMQQPGNDDLKAKMREALDRKHGNDRGVPHPAGAKQKAHGHEVLDGGPKVHRRKAGGGGS